MCDLHPLRIRKPRAHKPLDLEALSSYEELADKYNVTVSNAFDVLSQDVEDPWVSISTVILTAVRDVLPVVQRP